MENQKLENKREYEICVSCGKSTKVKKSTHIDYREGYVEGAGQLCKECEIKIYGE